MQIGDDVRLEWRDFSEFSADELYAMLRFRQAVFVVEQGSAYPDLDGLDRSAHHMLLSVGGAFAGYARLIPYKAENRVAIGRLAVAATRRGHGVARLIMEAALARCDRDYASCPVTLSAQTYLRQFYESLGFCAASPVYDDYGVAHLDMRRDPERE